jgi:hypothetical protein
MKYVSAVLLSFLLIMPAAYTASAGPVFKTASDAVKINSSVATGEEERVMKNIVIENGPACRPILLRCRLLQGGILLSCQIVILPPGSEFKVRAEEGCYMRVQKHRFALEKDLEYPAGSPIVIMTEDEADERVDFVNVLSYDRPFDVYSGQRKNLETGRITEAD